MKIIVGTDAPIEIGTTETTPTIGIVDYSRRVTDDFGVTTVVERGFSRRMSIRFALPTDAVDGVQRLLADLRATSAQWIADDGCTWLSPTGYYKDFEVDLAIPPLSFCTLTVEGLAETETVPDTGADPAPGGASTFQMLRPLAVTDAMLTSSTVPENDELPWAAGTTYPLGVRVIRTATHRIYESLIAGNIGNTPESSPTYWLDVGPTNRWAAFDEALGTATTAAAGPMVMTFDAGAVDAVALLDVVGDTAQVEVIAAGVTEYDRTITADGGSLTFLDLPGIAGTVRVTVAGTGALSVGTLLIGDLLGLGSTEASPDAGITDFSRKDVDDFGAVTIVQRGWAKRMTAQALIATDAVDMVANRIAAVRARPVLWIGDADLDVLTVYGFFKEFSIEVDQNVSKLALSIEGLSKATPLAPLIDLTPLGLRLDAVEDDLARVTSDDYLGRAEKPKAVVDWNALGANVDAMDDRFVAIGSPVDIVTFRDDAVAKLGALTTYLTGLTPAWTDASQDTPIIAATYRTRWVDAYAAASVFQAAITGRQGPPGADGMDGVDGVDGLNSARVFIFRRSASAPALPTATATYTFATAALTGLNNGWTTTVPAGTDALYVSLASAVGSGATDTIAAGDWATPVIQAVSGGSGTNGLNAATVYLYQRSATAAAPSVPAGTLTYTFASGGLSGTLGAWSTSLPTTGGQYRWMISASALGSGTTDTIATGEWATPAILAQDGADGQSIAELTIYRRATSAPATPTGGSYNFATKVLTPPSGWSVTFPAGTDPCYASSGAASVVGQTGTATPAWFGVGKVAQDGATGLDGVATNIVFRRSATQPATPAASVGTPAGWYDATGSVPAGADPIWASFGTRPNATAAYTWQVAKKLEGQDGVSPIQVDVLPSSVSIRGDAGGAAYPVLLPVVAQIVVRQGTNILTPTSVTIPSGGKVACDGTVSTTTATITSVSDADGSLSFDVVADGQTVRAKFAYAVVADGSPGATSASFTRSSPQVTSASYVDYGAAMAINADGAGNLKLTFTGSAKAPDGGDLILQSKWQIQPAGGSRTDISGSEKTSTQSQWTTDPDRQSAAQFGTSIYNLTGLTPGGAYLFYFMVRKTLTTWSNSATCDFRAMVERPS